MEEENAFEIIMNTTPEKEKSFIQSCVGTVRSVDAMRTVSDRFASID
jgi:hypothetical protein